MQAVPTSEWQLLYSTKKKAVVEDFNRYPMPGTQGEISKEEFFDKIAEHLRPVINRSGKIGFCFSFPAEILPNRDGKVVRFEQEEVKVRDIRGQELRQTFSN